MSQLPNFICHRECQFFIALEGAVRKIALTQAKLTLFIAFPRKGCSGGFLNIGVILEDRALVLVTYGQVVFSIHLGDMDTHYQNSLRPRLL